MLAVFMMTFMLPTFLLAGFTRFRARSELGLEGRPVSGGSAADQHLDGGPARRSAAGIQTYAVRHLRHVVFGEACIRTGGAGQQAIETGLDAILDALRRRFRVVPENLKTMVHNIFLLLELVGRTAGVAAPLSWVADLPRGRAREILEVEKMPGMNDA